MQQEVVLALLAKEPSYGYELRARLRLALGPLGEAMNDGQIYVTLTRLEKAGLVVSERAAGAADRPDRKVYGLTPRRPGAGRRVVGGGELAQARPGGVPSQAGRRGGGRVGGPALASWTPQRRELLRRLRDAQRAAMAEPDGSDAGLLLEGIVLRLQADLRWLEACEQSWTIRRRGS